MPAAFPGGSKAASPSPAGPEESHSGSDGERETRPLEALGSGTQAIPGLRRHRRSRPFHALFGLCRACIPVPLSLAVSTPFFSPPHHLLPCTLPQPSPAGHPEASLRGCVEEAAAARRRGWLLSLVI